MQGRRRSLWTSSTPERCAARSTGHEVVANLATHIPKTSRMAMPSAWNDNDRIRTAGSTNLADAALATGAGRFVQESIAFLYADAGDQWITEASEVLPKANLTTALSAESNAVRVAESGAIGVALRFAAFYGPDSHTTLDTVRFAKRRVAGGFGKDTYVSSITTDDAASAVLVALSAPSGLYNVVDDAAGDTPGVLHRAGRGDRSQAGDDPASAHGAAGRWARGDPVSVPAGVEQTLPRDDGLGAGDPECAPGMARRGGRHEVRDVDRLELFGWSVGHKSALDQFEDRCQSRRFGYVP